MIYIYIHIHIHIHIHTNYKSWLVYVTNLFPFQMLQKSLLGNMQLSTGTVLLKVDVRLYNVL